MTKSDEEIEAEKVTTARSLRREGNTCIGLGAGVGALGVGTAAVVGATCPLCFFVAPALVGMGIYGHVKAKRLADTTDEENS